MLYAHRQNMLCTRLSFIRQQIVLFLKYDSIELLTSVFGQLGLYYVCSIVILKNTAGDVVFFQLYTNTCVK